MTQTPAPTPTSPPQPWSVDPGGGLRLEDVDWPPLSDPFTLEGVEGAGACLMVHGFTGAPYHMQPLALRLNRALGMTCHALRLPGHCLADAQALNRTLASDWLAAVEDEAQRLWARTSGPRVIVGLSMGGVLALRFAQRRPASVDALVLLGSPSRLTLKGSVATALYKALGRPKLASLIPKTPRPIGQSEHFAADDPSYEVYPMDALLEVKALQASVRRSLCHVQQPTLIIHGQHDPTVPLPDAFELMEGLSSARNRLVILKRSLHVLTLDQEMPLLGDEVIAFLQSLA
jgi:carboxylesterase